MAAGVFYALGRGKLASEPPHANACSVTVIHMSAAYPRASRLSR